MEPEDDLDDYDHFADDAHKLTGEQLDKLNSLHRRAMQVLLTCRTVFPFDLFPNTLIVDVNKVDIIYRNFFRISHTVSIPIARINYVDTALFLSTLRIDVKGWEQDPPPLIFLKTKDAHLAKNLIFGLMSAAANNIDLTKLSNQAIISKLVDIGRAA